MHLPVLVDGHHPYDRRACRLPAFLLSVHKHVDHLCATAPSLCIRVEMLGIPLPGRNHDRGLYLGERESHPVHAEKTGIIHTPRRNG